MKDLEVGAPIAQDAVGVWHQARYASRAVTLRILREEAVDTPGARELMLEEVRRVATLEHPALLRVLARSPRSPRPWYATDPIWQGTLAQHLEGGARLAWPEARALGERLVDAAEALAARKQVHILPTPERVLALDAGGVFTTFRDVRARDEVRMLKGRQKRTTGFEAPEVDPGHAAGVTPAALLAWQVGALVHAALGAGPPRPGAPAAGLPAPAREILGRLLALEPAERPQGPAAIRRALAGETGTDAPRPPSGPVLRRGRRRRE